MAFPPVIPPATRANATPLLDTHPADHNAISAALTDIVTQLNPSTWTALTLTSPWVNSGGNYPAQYRKIGDVVEMRGVVNGGTNGSTLFTLPAGFRPASQQIFPTVSGDGAAARVNIANTGVATANFSTPANATFMPLTFTFSVLP